MRSFLFVIVFFLSNISFGNYNNAKFKRLTTSDGLSNGWVRCFYQDNYGFIWIWTSDGLDRFDGINIKTYRPINEKGFEEGNNTVNKIFSKNNDTLLVCTDLGLYIYSYISDEFAKSTIISGPFSILSGQYDSEGLLWLGTSRGLMRVNEKNKDVHFYEHSRDNSQSIGDNYINAILLDSKNNLWFGTKQGLSLYNFSDDSFLNFKPDGRPYSLSGKDVMAIKEDHKGRIWVGNSLDGVDLVEKHDGSISFKHICDGNIIDLLPDSDDKLWLGNGSGIGLSMIDISEIPDSHVNIKRFKNDPLNQHSISENSIVCLFEDKNKDIWIGTFGKGVNYYSKREKRFEAVEIIDKSLNSNDNNIVNDFFEEEKFFWIATEGGLVRLDKQTGKYKHYSHNSEDVNSLAINSLFDIYKDSRENLWIGSWAGGLHRYNYKSDNFTRFLPSEEPGSINSAYVFSIAEDKSHNLWVSTNGGGLNVFNYETETFTSYINDNENVCSIRDNYISHFLFDSEDNLYVSLYTKIDRLSKDRECFTPLKIPVNNENEFFEGSTIVIFEDSRKNMWYGTNQGLLKYNPGDKIAKQYNTKEGLKNNSIQSILEDNNGNLWIGTSKGLTMFVDAVEVPDKPVFKNFTKNDGLPSEEFKKRSSFKNSMGYMYFGTSNGYVRFHPDSIFFNDIKPLTVLTRMVLHKTKENGEVLYNKVINNIFRNKSIELKYGYADFLINFASINYLHPEANDFKYKLEGYDDEWFTLSSKSTVAYTNIEPGTYTFMVYGSNNDKLWSEEPATLIIKIIPPWWKTIFFKIALLILTICIALLIFFMRVRILSRRNIVLQQKIDERTYDLVNLNKQLNIQKIEIEEKNIELFEHQNRLEDLVRERTKELEKAKDKAEESDRLKSAFLANLSHEIRTPMNSIMGFASLLPEEDSKENIDKYSRIIYNNSEQLNHIIDDIVLYSKLQTKQLGKRYTTFSVLEMLYDVKISFDIPDYQSSVSLSVAEGIDSEMKIHTDYDKLRQILTNLISNAFKYTYEGSIVIGAYKKDHAVEFYVKDTGVGIPSDELHLIFNRFYRCSNIDKGNIRGSGLGLSIVKELVEMLGGSIKAESREGEGSCFTFTIQ
ncbi:MAG: hypothetical protein KA807_18245 [Prolixibacteraceae bacterium]|nr:hypothetical protein [Prolixibacteraceae bacterium]